jgi:hypothetical protein
VHGACGGACSCTRSNRTIKIESQSCCLRGRHCLLVCLSGQVGVCLLGFVICPEGIGGDKLEDLNYGF